MKALLCLVVTMTTNSQATTIALARRLAMADNRNQQAAIVQCAARLLDGADDETKDSLMRLIASTPAQRQERVGLTERLILSA